MQLLRREHISACGVCSDESGETLVKSLAPNNLMNPGTADQSSSVSKDLGISSRSLGKKDSSRTGGAGFSDFLMQAMKQEQGASAPTPKVSVGAPSPAPTPNLAKSSASDKQVSDRLERDLADKRSAQPIERAPTKSSVERVDQKDRDKDLASKPQRSSKPETERNDATSNSSAASRDLRPLKMAVGNKTAAENMAGNNAVLSFLTGRLDRLDPEGIPGIITGNPFLKEAAASEDVMDMMLQPMPIADLCKLFEIDQSVLNKAVANGLDVSAIVTPKEFLTAIGIDASRVTSELQMMQQKLPLEGVKSYVDRARAMAQNITAKKPMLGEEITIEVVTPLDAQGVEAAIANSSRIEEEKSGQPTPGPVPPVGLNVPTTMPTVAMGSGQQNISKPNPAGVTKVDTRARVSPDDLMESLIAGRAMSTVAPGLSDISGPTTEKLGLNNSSLDLSSISLPKEQDVGFDSELDPYALLGQDMKAFNSEMFSYAPVTVGKSMSNLEEQLSANGFALKQEIAVPQKSELSGVSKDSLSDLILEKDSELSPPDLLTTKENSAHGVKNLAEGLPLAVEGLSHNSGSKQSFQDSMSGGTEQKDAKSSSENISSVGGMIGSAGATKAQGFGAVLETGAASAPQEPSNNLSGLHNKIMQHATMMLKDGGGSMRMNVDAPGMGKIDLAINLNNSQLDVRILTPNDHVRDIINKELSGLRDGLGQQGISLRAVEVGNASQSSNQFAGGRFGQGHNGQQASYNEMKEYAKSFAGSFPSREASNTRMSVRDVRNNIPSSWLNSARDVSKISVRI